MDSVTIFFGINSMIVGADKLAKLGFCRVILEPQKGPKKMAGLTKWVQI
jgi:hypothetical protein